MKNVSEFTKTQALIDEYNKVKNKVPNLETQMKQNEKRTKVKIEKLKSDMQENQEDVEYKLDRASVEAEYGKQIEQEEKNLEEENGKIKEEINKAKEDKKFFCTDKNFKTITMEIEAMKKEIEEGKLKIKQKEDELEKYDKLEKYELKKYELKKCELEYQKFSAESDKENPLKLLEIRKEWEKKAQEIREKREKKKQEIGKINKEIDAMNKKIEEYSEFKGELNQQLSTFTAIDFNKMRERENNKTDKPEEEYEDIYSNSQDFVKAIHIEAATGKAYIDTFKNNKKEIDIKEAIENRKGLYKKINLKEIMEKAGVESRINQFMLKRKINPVILKAINEDEKMTEEYIYSLIEKKEFPFKYEIDLENSSLDNKTTNFLNRIALKENKIEGNEVKGTEKLRTLKSFFRGISDKAHNRFAKKEEPKRLETGKDELDKTKKSENKFKEQYTVDVDKKIEEQNMKNQQAYAELTNEQKLGLSNMSIRDIQNLGYDYSTAVGLLEIGRENSKKENEPQKVENGDNEVEKEY